MRRQPSPYRLRPFRLWPSAGFAHLGKEWPPRSGCTHFTLHPLSLILLSCLCLFSWARAQEEAIPPCDRLWQEQTYELSPLPGFHFPVFPTGIGHLPASPDEGDPIEVYADMAAKLWDVFDLMGRPEVYLYWTRGEGDAWQVEPMYPQLQERPCRYKKRAWLFLSRSKVRHAAYRVRFYGRIPPQPRGTKIRYLVKGFVQGESPLTPALSKAVVRERDDPPPPNLPRLASLSSVSLIPLEGLWDNLDLWDKDPFLASPRLVAQRNLIEQSQAAYDGQYLYFRLKTKEAMEEGQCDAYRSRDLRMNVYGVLLRTPEYEPLEAGAGPPIRGWLLIYAPCINRIYQEADAALYEASTLYKGPERGSGAEAKFLAENDLVLRIPHKKLGNHESLLAAAIFFVGVVHRPGLAKDPQLQYRDDMIVVKFLPNVTDASAREKIERNNSKVLMEHLDGSLTIDVPPGRDPLKMVELFQSYLDVEKAELILSAQSALPGVVAPNPLTELQFRDGAASFINLRSYTIAVGQTGKKSRRR